MKDAYSFDADDEARCSASYRRHVRRLRAHLHAPRPGVPRGGGRQRRDRRHAARTNSMCSPTPARTRSSFCPTVATTRPTSSSPRRCRRPRARAAATSRCAKVADAGQDAPARTSPRCSSMPLERTVKSLVLAIDERCDGDATIAIWLLLLRGDHELNEIKAQQVPGLGELPLRDRSRDRRARSAREPGYLGPVGTQAPVRSSPTARSRRWRLRLRRQRGRTSTSPA